jgi:hypothetical protein
LPATFLLEKPMRSLILAATLLTFVCISDANAQSRCRVTDPTGTPLNLRAAPNGPIVGTLQNGRLVTILAGTVGPGGKPWVHIASFETGEPLGWVFREFIACF